MALTTLLAAISFLPMIGPDEFPDVPENHWAYAELYNPFAFLTDSLGRIIQSIPLSPAPSDVPKNHWAYPAVGSATR